MPVKDPANDNENPDESWRRADLMLAAYSGEDVAERENAKTAITRLLTDLMHYCEVRNILTPPGHREHFGFDNLLAVAYEHYHTQSMMMNDVIENALQGEARLREQRSQAEQKGLSMPQDPEFTARIPFAQDPEFLKLERDLQLRQEEARKKLLEAQTQQRADLGRQAGVTREMLDDNYDKQLQERAALDRRHKEEHDRYIRDYHDAKVLRDELKEREKSQALEDAAKFKK